MEASHNVAGETVAGDVLGIGAVGDGNVAFGAVGALGEAGGGVVGVCASDGTANASAPAINASTTAVLPTTNPPLSRQGNTSKTQA